MKLVKLSCLIISVIFSGLVVADGWTPYKKISGIIIEGGDTTGKALLLIEGGVPAVNIPPECNSPYNMVDLTTEKGRGILSVALSARMSDKPVKLALTCNGARPFITHIWL